MFGKEKEEKDRRIFTENFTTLLLIALRNRQIERERVRKEINRERRRVRKENDERMKVSSRQNKLNKIKTHLCSTNKFQKVVSL